MPFSERLVDLYRARAGGRFERPNDREAVPWRVQISHSNQMVREWIQMNRQFMPKGSRRNYLRSDELINSFGHRSRIQLAALQQRVTVAELLAKWERETADRMKIWEEENVRKVELEQKILSKTTTAEDVAAVAATVLETKSMEYTPSILSACSTDAMEVESATTKMKAVGSIRKFVQETSNLMIVNLVETSEETDMIAWTRLMQHAWRAVEAKINCLGSGFTLSQSIKFDLQVGRPYAIKRPFKSWHLIWMISVKEDEAIGVMIDQGKPITIKRPDDMRYVRPISRSLKPQGETLCLQCRLCEWSMHKWRSSNLPFNAKILGYGENGVVILRIV